MVKAYSARISLVLPSLGPTDESLEALFPWAHPGARRVTRRRPPALVSFKMGGGTAAKVSRCLAGLGGL